MNLQFIDKLPGLERIEASKLDQWLLLLVASLALLGMVAMGSASMEYAHERYDNAFHHVIRHSIYLGIACFTGATVMMIPMQTLERLSVPLLFAGVGLLVLVLIPQVGVERNGSSRWLPLGPLTLQPAELMKLFAVLYIAGYLVRRGDEVRQQWSGFLKPMAIMAVIVSLLILQPDFGSVVVVTCVVLGLLFLGGVRLSQFSALGAVCVAAGTLMIVTSEYRMRRISAFTDPWADQFASGYHLVQSLIAFGRGEIFGVGLGNSVQKLLYLPEAHTDFVFAIWAEEQGAVGAILVIGLFAALVGRMLWVGRAAHTAGLHFGGYVAYGIGLLVSMQVFINIGVNAGLLPTKGLTLPFFSFGGTSLIVLFGMLALVLRVDYEVRQEQAK